MKTSSGAPQRPSCPGSYGYDLLDRKTPVFIFIALYFFAGVSTLTDLHNWGGDFSHYIFQARALVENGALLELRTFNRSHILLS